MRPVPADDLLALAVRAARAAGELLADRFGDPATGIAAKSTRTDLVSDADREAEALIAGMIRAERPDDGLMGEEGALESGGSGLRWLVDPLDGTINYLWAVPQWSVSIACLDAEGPLVGVVYDPPRGETFTAVRGRGARRGEAALSLAGRRRARGGAPGHGLRLRRGAPGAAGAPPADRAARGARRAPLRLGRHRPGLGGLRAAGRLLRDRAQPLGRRRRRAAGQRGRRDGRGAARRGTACPRG